MRLFGRGRAPPRGPAILPAGQRAYAIGDVHGRLDLLEDLLARIAADDATRTPAETHLVLLGDLIDRGPDSRGVLALLRGGTLEFDDVHMLMGNHEEMLLRLIDRPSPDLMAHYLRLGGGETLRSYGVPDELVDGAAERDPAAMLAFVPQVDRALLRGLGDSVRLGDYLFVHAGIRPGVPLDEQAVADLRWIRAPFLQSEADHGVTVVHGHTITPSPELRANRIGIDTGAFATGILTAVGLQGADRWILATDGSDC